VEDEKIITAVQEVVRKVDAGFARVDAQFDEVREQFREVKMNIERLDSEMKLWNMKVDVLGGRINRLMDEVKLPSGSISQRFAEVRQLIADGDQQTRSLIVDGDHQTRILIEKLDTKVQLMGEHVDVVNEKLDRFRATVEGAR